MIQKSLTFDDVLLVPKYSDIESRKEVDIGNRLGTYNLRLPIISAPMDTVTEDEMSSVMSFNGGMGIIHRYNTIEQQSQIIQKAAEQTLILAAAVGVTGDFLERAQEIIKWCDIICIDVAHGDHILVKNAIEQVKKLSNIHVMAGNVATGQSFVRLAKWGADSIRVGIGGGSICSTRINTGFGVPNLSAIFDCVTEWNKHLGLNHRSRPPLIIDGGIKNAGDIVKALAAGADFVMCGSMLAGTKESPGDILDTPEFGLSKVYRGMASREAQTDFKGSSSAPEGISSIIPYKGSVVDILKDLDGNIRSGFSYAGARDIHELRKNATFIEQSHAGQQESKTHILNYGKTK